MTQKIFTSIIVFSVGLYSWGQNVESSDSLECELQEIVVTANQPATRLVGNALVSTIAGSNLQNMGTALDVLAQLPMITVNDGSISIVGKGVPEIFIDGRIMHDENELMQLQSNNIKKVELIMAPGALYASDAKAVLRITTRHSFIEGLSLVNVAKFTARRKLSADDMLDLNYRHREWDIFATGAVSRENGMIKGRTLNTFSYNGVETRIGSSQNNSYPSTAASVKSGFNFSGNGQSFGAYYRYNPEHADFKNIGTEWLNDSPRIDRNISRGARSHDHLASVYYDGEIENKYQLHFDGDFRCSRSFTDVSTSYPDSELADVNSSDSRKSELLAGKLYMAFPLWRGDFVVGTQDSRTCTKLDYRMLNDEVGEYIPSLFTDARQISAAAFASWNRMFGRFNLSAGLRYEYVDYLFKRDGIKVADMSRKDHLLTPDVSLGYFFDDQSQLNLTYKMSTVKPPYSQLTGSLNYVGLHEIEGGNPGLRDERMHDLQIFGMWNDFILQADYTRSIDTYGFVKRLYPGDKLQLLLQPENINVSAVDIYLVWSKNIRSWSPNFTLGMHKQWLDIAGQSYNRPIFSYYLDNMLSFPNDFLLTVNVNGQTKGDMHTNCFGATWFTINASVSKSFLSKSLQVKFSVTDIFNTANNNWTMNTYGVFVDKRQSYDRRGVSLAVTYNFQPRKSKYKGNAASEMEMKRF